MNKIILITILLIAFVLRLSVVMRGDEMYDEIAVVRSGEIYIGGFKDLNFGHDIWIVNYEHPPMAKYIFGLAGTVEHNIPLIHDTFDAEFHPDKGYFLPKFLSTLIGVLTIFIVYFVTKKWFDEKKAIFGSLFLALMPAFVAHNAIAGLETPQVLFSLLLVYFYIEGIFDTKKPDIKKIYLSFIFFALLFLTKFSGLFFGFFYLFTYIYYLVKQKAVKSDLLLIHISGVFLFCGIVYLLWPWLWLDPTNIFKSFGYFANSHGGEFFFGSLGQPPWYYYFAYFSATTPPVILFSLLLAVFFFIGKKVPENHRRNLTLTLVWLISPFLISFIGLKQDGIRYVFSFFPPLAILAGYGFSTLLDKFNLKNAALITVLSILTIVWSLAVFHPYYLDYYNILYGGTKSVYQDHKFDYAWWGEGINEAVEYVNENFAEEGLSVRQWLHPQHTAPLYDDRLVFMNSYDPVNPPDIILLSEYHHYYGAPPPYIKDYTEVHAVKVVDIPLVRIYKRVK